MCMNVFVLQGGESGKGDSATESADEAVATARGSQGVTTLPDIVPKHNKAPKAKKTNWAAWLEHLIVSFFVYSVHCQLFPSELIPFHNRWSVDDQPFWGYLPSLLGLCLHYTPYLL